MGEQEIGIELFEYPGNPQYKWHVLASKDIPGSSQTLSFDDRLVLILQFKEYVCLPQWKDSNWCDKTEQQKEMTKSPFFVNIF